MIDPLKDIESKVRQEEQIPEKQEYRFHGSERKRPGLTLWRYEIEHQRLSKTKITSQVAIGTDGKEKTSHRASFDPKSVYIWALNWKNAVKKVKKLGYELENE